MPLPILSTNHVLISFYIRSNVNFSPIAELITD